MQHKQLVPSLHAQVLNPHIDFSATPFVVQQELTEWKQLQVESGEADGGKPRPYGPLPRRAGISSFGAGGS
jgi:acyl transferase domain-containing protein